MVERDREALDARHGECERMRGLSACVRRERLCRSFDCACSLKDCFDVSWHLNTAPFLSDVALAVNEECASLNSPYDLAIHILVTHHIELIADYFTRV